MVDSMSYRAAETPAWKSIVSTASAILLAVLFLVSGAWKVTDPIGWAARVAQLQVPALLAMPATLVVGALEIFAGALLFVPRFRRWGAWLTAGLLVAFMVYIGIHYNTLRGEDCSCFPWLQRAVGPGFFISDAVMLAMALVAGWWAVPSYSRRGAALVLAAISVFTAASYGLTIAQQGSIQAPDSVTVEGNPYPLRQGRVFVYFFDPACSHCLKAAQQMASWTWKQARILAVPTATPQFAGQFLSDTGLRADVTNDADRLREVFQFNDPPYAVALEDGRQRAAVIHFDETEPRNTLASLGWIE